ncbi:MAG: hypothetical protein V2G41_10120 [bacterium JZ-2024 1]
MTYYVLVDAHDLSRALARVDRASNGDLVWTSECSDAYVFASFLRAQDVAQELGLDLDDVEILTYDDWAKGLR